MRLLPCVRLSIETDETTSPERQMDKIRTYARLADHELVPITETDYDLDVSGSVSPFERPGLGPWLRDDRLEKWDAICVARLDRLTRSLFDFVTLTSWLEARGKTLICLNPVLDLSTPAGRAFASITATLAQFEHETIAARVRDAWHRLRESGKYGGGQVPFGYSPVKLEKGWGYEPDPVYGPIVAEMFDRYSRTESLGSITRWLNETRIPTPWNVTRLRGKKPTKDTLWKATSVRKILASPAVLGATIKTDGTPVRDRDGVVLYRADALVSRAVWERVQTRLANNPVKERKTLQRAQEELVRLHSLTPVAAREAPVATGQTFRQRWEALDASGRNGLLRENKVRAVVSRDEPPPFERQEGPSTALDSQRTAIIDRPGLHAMLYLGSLGDMMSRADGLAASANSA